MDDPVSMRRFKILRLPLDLLPDILRGSQVDERGVLHIVSLTGGLPEGAVIGAVSTEAGFASNELWFRVYHESFKPVCETCQAEYLRLEYRQTFIPQSAVDLIASGEGYRLADCLDAMALKGHPRLADWAEKLRGCKQRADEGGFLVPPALAPAIEAMAAMANSGLEADPPHVVNFGEFLGVTGSRSSEANI